MNAPVDYPINDEARTTRFSVDELRYAAILDRKSAEQSPDVVNDMATCEVSVKQSDLTPSEAVIDQAPLKIQKKRSAKPPVSFASMAQSRLVAQSNQFGHSSVLSRLTRSIR